MNKTAKTADLGPQTAKAAIATIPEWQRRLRLADWTIEAVVTDQTSGGLARVTSLPKYKAAKIELLDPAKIDADQVGNKDLEVSIVHELLHLQAEFVTALFCKKRYKRYNDDMERLVELTAQALVALKREKHGR